MQVLGSRAAVVFLLAQQSPPLATGEIKAGTPKKVVEGTCLPLVMMCRAVQKANLTAWD